MNTDLLRKKLLELHLQENDLNKEMTNLGKEIFKLEKKKKKIAKMVSTNMKYRNKLIEQL